MQRVTTPIGAQPPSSLMDPVWGWISDSQSTSLGSRSFSKIPGTLPVEAITSDDLFLAEIHAYHQTQLTFS
eukprot:11082969-Ditylum_brightwellii.AAC.1